MKPKIPLLQITNTIPVDEPVVYLIPEKFDFSRLALTKTELTYVKSQIENKETCVSVNSYFKWSFVVVFSLDATEPYVLKEKARIKAYDVYNSVSKIKINILNIVDFTDSVVLSGAFAEGMILSAYSFNKYFTDKEKKNNNLEIIKIQSVNLNDKEVEKINIVAESVYIARDLVNEPLSYLTAHKLAENIQTIGKNAGFEVEVFDKKKIEALRMGGILAVNRGSIEPPSFSIMTWKPDNAINKTPYVIIGKGIVFDTGGLSLKPTPGSMDSMKSDMAGAAAVTGCMNAIAKAKLPLYVIGLVPATDNRPGENAYVPQDIISMYNGTTVEVLNTDAEGRLLLADALAYAQNYDPEAVIDLATLTGAAVVAVGTIAIAGMGNNRTLMDQLIASGNETYERIVELPLWDEYDEYIKSDFADLKNIGGKWAGSITAGKFLQHFTDYPWVHLDIAGTAYLDSTDKYRGKAATGNGVRLLFDFFAHKINL